MNKLKIILFSSVLITVIAISFYGFSIQNDNEPWNEKQLIQASELVEILSNPKNEEILIYNIGPSGSIKNAINIGEGGNEQNIEKLKKEISSLSKDTDIVIYCGCCPFGNCPNIRPVFQLLNKMKFINHRLLNLPENLKVDWIDKGYPMSN